MVTYRSNGGKGTTNVEERWQVLRSLLIFLLVVGVCLGAILYFNNKKEKADDPVAANCSHVIENSVFSTGTPLTDQRILWAIVNDKSANKDAAAGIVDHLWENADFKFSKPEEQKLWDAAVNAVPQITSPIHKPALSITKEGVIIPFKEPSEVKDVMWTEVSVSGIPAQRSTFLMTSTAGNQKTNPVPLVLLSINGGSMVPSPTLGIGSEHTAINTKEVCKS